MNKNKILTEKKELQKKFQIILEKINQTLPFLLDACLSPMKYCIDTWDKEDWEDYAKKTGNNPLKKMSIPKNGFEKAIDDATGYNISKDCDMLKFSIWFAEGFLDGVLDGVLNGYDEK